MRSTCISLPYSVGGNTGVFMSFQFGFGGDIASSGVGKESEENEKVKKEQVKRIRRQGCQVIGTLAGGLSFQNKGWNL